MKWHFNECNSCAIYPQISCQILILLSCFLFTAAMTLLVAQATSFYWSYIRNMTAFNNLKMCLVTWGTCFLQLLKKIHLLPLTTECGKVMFVVISVCPHGGRRVQCDHQLDLFKLVHLRTLLAPPYSHHTGTPLTHRDPLSY